MGMQLDVLRHGETVLSHTLRGSTDDELTDLGWQQMQQTIEQVRLKGYQWDIILSSPLQRCQKFAEQLAQKLNIPLRIESYWQEMHFGIWEAQTTHSLYQQFPDQLALFWKMPTQYTPPQAESIIEFQARIHAGLQQLKNMPQQRILLVSHGGVIKLLKTIALKKSLDDVLKMQAELGELHHFQFDVDQQLQWLAK